MPAPGECVQSFVESIACVPFDLRGRSTLAKSHDERRIRFEHGGHVFAVKPSRQWRRARQRRMRRKARPNNARANLVRSDERLCDVARPPCRDPEDESARERKQLDVTRLQNVSASHARAHDLELCLVLRELQPMRRANSIRHRHPPGRGYEAQRRMLWWMVSKRLTCPLTNCRFHRVTFAFTSRSSTRKLGAPSSRNVGWSPLQTMPRPMSERSPWRWRHIVVPFRPGKAASDSGASREHVGEGRARWSF